MNVIARAVGHIYNSFTSPLTVPIVNSVGDGIIVIGACRSAGATFTPPTGGGWVQLYYDSLIVTGATIVVYYCANATGAAGYAFGCDGTANRFALSAKSFYNHNPTAIINVIDHTVHDALVTNDFHCLAPSVTTTINGCLEIAIGVAPNPSSFGHAAYTSPTGFTNADGDTDDIGV
jgi:hypothetical protein